MRLKKRVASVCSKKASYRHWQQCEYRRRTTRPTLTLSYTAKCWRLFWRFLSYGYVFNSAVLYTVSSLIWGQRFIIVAYLNVTVQQCVMTIAPAMLWPLHLQCCLYTGMNAVMPCFRSIKMVQDGHSGSLFCIVRSPYLLFQQLPINAYVWVKETL